MDNSVFKLTNQISHSASHGKEMRSGIFGGSLSLWKGNKRTENIGFSNRHIHIAMKKVKFNPLPPTSHSYIRSWNCYLMY